MNIKEVLDNGKNILIKKDIEEATLISRVLLSHILKCRKEELLIRQNEKISDEQKRKYLNGIEKICEGYPLQYITHTKEFMGMNFYVDENVLVPRNDTEVLVEEIIKLANDENKKSILELCTGSGAIAISLAQYLKDATITATDISEGALSIAKKNEKELLEEKKIKFIKGNMFQNIDKEYDVIVSNPPYIKTDVISEYKLKYEPQIALDGGQDGLKFYRIIIEEGYKYLNENGIIAIEIGYDQKEQVIEIARHTGKYKEIYYKQDLFGNDRVIVIKL